MTVNVKNTIEKIYNNDIFNKELYFVGGTALSFYLNHRVSEDIDIVSSSTLDYKSIIPNMNLLGARQIKDENATALRLAGLFPEEYILKFILDNVKIEFFQANRPIQKEVLSTTSYESFQGGTLKILDVKSIAKLKLIALVMRDKSRDLFDFGAVLKNHILSIDEIIALLSKVDNKIATTKDIINFIKAKKEQKDDEAVYLNENDRVDLNFTEIQEDVIKEVILTLS
jgi:predicted nucleotidyltransferase component of viral defense system